MKKKITNAVLGIVVIVIWTIGLKGIINGLDDGGRIVIPVKPLSKNPPFDDYGHQKDTARLLLNYRDPFGFGPAASHTDTVLLQSGTRKKLPAARPATTVDLSFIKYSGYIYNPASKKTISIMIVNGKSVMVADGEVADGIRLIRNMRDSVKISYMNKVRFISRS